MCTEVASEAQVPPECFGKSVDCIRAVLKAWQVQFGEEIEAKGEQKSRAIYTADVQLSSDLEQAQLLGFNFGGEGAIDFD